ncbi:hypothetical protein D1872_278880 [compost metagenome]
MQNEHISLRHIHSTLALLYTKAVIQLHGAQVGDDRNARGLLSYLKGISQLLFLHSSADRAKSQCPASGLCCCSKPLINLCCASTSPCHRANKERCLQLVSQKIACQLDVIKIHLRQWVMLEYK